MKKITFLFLFIATFSINAQVSISPSAFLITDEITITVDINSSSSCNGIVNPQKVYVHAGVGNSPNNGYNIKVVGNFNQDDGIGQMTSNGDGTYSITLTPSTYFNLTSSEQAAATHLGLVFRNQNGSQEFKDTNGSSCKDFILPIGLFQFNVTAPTEEITYLNSGQNFVISASTTQNATFTLTSGGSTVSSASNTQNFSFNENLTATKSYVLEATDGTNTFQETFTAIVRPTLTPEAIPTGLKEGINYVRNQNDKAYLVLRAPGKDYVYVAGSFNNYQFNDAYLMKQDTNESDLFWLELTGLNDNEIYTYQYWVMDETPISGSSKLVKTADPYSTLVLGGEDGNISSATYPNLPDYPSGQSGEVTVLQTGQTAYNWQVNNFTKPKKEDLVIYEVLIRDFDADRNFQDLIDKISYFKNLNINAIQLMPIMEFEADPSWGYDSAFHMALEKSYGTADKLKEFIDLCHQNGIAVILDIALNHAFGRSPLVKMWMDGNFNPTSENPYLNTVAKHPFNVGSDFNHESQLTKNFTKRVIEHWIREFRIDGFRWDLSKGFTQKDSGNDVGAWGNYDASRIAILKDYADYQWSLDPNFYVILEHFADNNEEQELAGYRANETTPKGMMLWGNMHGAYENYMKGNSSDISGMSSENRGFSKRRLVGYPESHDEERMMYASISSGISLTNSLKRMGSLAATSILVPGPKMIWHFASLGMDDSIFTCANGSINSNCRLDVKPQPQWTENWLSNTNRKALYDNYSQLINLKINEPVFEGDYTLVQNNNIVKMYFFDLSLPSNSLRNVVVLANFNKSSQNVTPDFPFTGTWYDLMNDNTPVSISNTAAAISIPAGEFRVYGNMVSTLSNNEVRIDNSLYSIYPNPAKSSIQISADLKHVIIYNILGMKVKEFKGNFTKASIYSIQDLPSGTYIVKAFNNKGFFTKRLVKE